ncbi:MAG: glycosyltransferase 87 family protein [Propionibacteriaceae bacterium]|jgi:alpha-1,2-mannosyltransferase|nr:glycosyltransferase 87 family protein [Propionibacteriaceae bacterium]
MGIGKWVKRLGMFLLPLLAAMYIAGTLIPGSELWPWHPGILDLEVYQRTGQMVLAGEDFFHVADGLPWIYPPFAALLSIPFGLVPLEVGAVAWLALCVVALGAVLRRLGIHGWWLSLAVAACILFVEPVRETIGFGQLGILLVAAVCLDSLPSRSSSRPVLRRRNGRILPEGWLTGLATAVKLTPAVIAVYKFFAGERKQGLTAFASFCAATALGFVLYGPSLYYWNALAHGETGVNGSFNYATNQSVMGVWARLSGTPSSPGLLLSVVVILLGVIAAISMHKSGQAAVALVLAGLTSLLGSPVSWSHHYVWIVPLGIVFWQAKALPAWYRWLGLAYTAWVALAPFKALPRDNDVELSYEWWQQLVCNAGVGLGIALLLGAFFAARSMRAEMTPVAAGR